MSVEFIAKKGHGHCIENFCPKLSHAGSDYCTFNCQKKDHVHCSHRNCEEISEEGEIFCVKCCRKSGHGHCYLECIKIPHEESVKDRCIEHCEEEGHGHCAHYFCAKELLHGSRMCILHRKDMSEK